MKYIIYTILTLAFISCNTTTNHKNTTTYFGGEIINPKTNFVLFLKDDKVIDTLTLDKNNRFMFKFTNLNEGLYTFKHGLEFQYVYVEPKDSILVRLNYWDFDESLVFSGKGSSKNEFLINLFLQNEKEEDAMYHYFSLSEQEFNTKIDSLSNERELIYTEFLTAENDQVSDGFKKLTNTAIHYPLYRLKEIYPYFYKKTHELENFPTLSDNFYKFRDNINLNEENLVSFYPYQNYVINYLYNLSYQVQENDSLKNNLTVNVLNTIAEQIKLEDFRNTLLKKVIVNDFLKSESTCIMNTDAYNLFLKNCNNPEYVTQVTNLVNDSKIVVNNEIFQDFEIATYNNKSYQISDVIKNNNSVIYFWSTEFMSIDYLVSRIKYLENEYPNILFIGINMQSSTKESIKNELNLKLLDSTKQFKLTNESSAHNYLTSKYPRTIIINKNGIVENGFTYLDSKKLGVELNKLK